jgi:hypothetical protein
LATGLVCGVVERASAQDMPPIMAPLPPAVPTPPAPVLPATPVMPTVSIQAAQELTEAQLDQLVAPIALYPDLLLGQMLMASIYPEDVSEAARWVHVPANRGLSGDALTAALRAKGWNPSVMALAPFPSLLAIMADKLDWTEQLGKAFLAQQGEVMAAVQHLRRSALAAGNLKATPECHCVIQTSGDIISIQPSEGSLVSIPIYNPAVAYGSWADAAYPPATFPIPQGFVFTPGKGVGFNPAIEVALFGPFWGWESLDWPNRRIIINEARYAALQPGHVAFAGGAWVHEAAPPRKIARNAPSMATHPGHHARSAAMRRFAMTHPPGSHSPYWWGPRHQVWGLPPGTIVPPPPPPPYHAFRDPRDGYFDPYR